MDVELVAEEDQVVVPTGFVGKRRSARDLSVTPSSDPKSVLFFQVLHSSGLDSVNNGKDLDKLWLRKAGKRVL